MRGAVLNCRIVKILTLLMVIIPTPARSHANFVHVPSLADTRIRDILDEPDPDDTGDCLSLGELDIVFRTGTDGPPHVGVVLTDPRGRRIGFDPLIKHAWQALPVAQGDINCDDLGRTNTCRGIVQVCGPISGTYKIEIIALKTTAYSVSVLARSACSHIYPAIALWRCNFLFAENSHRCVPPPLVLAHSRCSPCLPNDLRRATKK
jgi:hypothetical protein